MQIKIVELSVIGLYLFIMVAIGVLFHKKAQSSTSGFWSADANVGWVVNSFAILATLMSGGGMLGNMGVAATLGLVYISMATWGTGIGIGISAAIIAPPLRKSKARTLSDFMLIRYESTAVACLVALVVTISYTVYLVAQMKAAGTVGEFVLGTSYTTAMIITWVVFTLYTVAGGMLAVTWNDFLQGILMMIVVVISLATALITFGGYGNLMEQATAAFPNIGAWHLPSISYIGFFMVWFGVQMCAPMVLMRVATAKSPFSAGLSMHGAMFLLSIFIFGTLMVVGPASRAIAGADQLANNDAYYLLFVEKSFGPIMKGVVGAAIFAAVMSTAAGLLLAAAAAFSNDILVRMIKMTPKGESRAASFTCIAISIVVLLLSFDPPKLLTILYSQAMSFLMVSLLGPFLLGLWWKRATAAGACAGVLVGALSFVALRFTTLPPFSEAVICLPLSVVAVIVISLITPKPSLEKVRQIESWHYEEENIGSDAVGG